MANHEQAINDFKIRPGVIALIVFIVLGFAFIVSATFSRRTNPARMTIAISNGKQIGQALINFDLEYGSFPDDKTAGIFAENYPNLQLTGSHSNDYFRQLFISDVIDSESIFFAGIGRSIRRPDDNFEGDEALASGENAWSYLMNADGTGLSTASYSTLPILILPLLSESGDTLHFDSKPFDGRAVFIRLNNSAETIKLDKGGQVPASDIYPTITGSHGKDISSFHKTKILYPEGLNKE